MELEVLNKGIAINEQIENAKAKKSIIHKLYSKKEDLKPEQLEKLFAIAINSVGFELDRLSRDLKNL
ncbi:hypothetical protein [Pseudotamlana carrageenivorans]|uniref:Uncharacterized protein n=1 Tax=Pseudotamlana carrageenivorans TaxID=2069432 RepID=A0A2I7SKV9_9FLAO|nr:hypothetical protein [Tamlana carrageenivorans]AUS06464.1 hypothetical protein C1A40_13870 [Tamlana carrageenivorans]